MDGLRSSIGLRAYGQRDPLLEYKGEAFKLFGDLMVNIKTEICHNIFRSASSMLAFEQFLRKLPKRAEHNAPSSSFGTTSTASPAGPGGTAAPAEGQGSDVVSEANEALAKARPVRTGPKVGRNDPCTCGSGKKFKNCCGKNG